MCHGRRICSRIARGGVCADRTGRLVVAWRDEATLATAMYFTGLDPHGGKPVHVAKGGRERSRQRALLLYWKREEAPHVREALRAWGRTDLIGKGPQHLVPPGPTFGAWTKHHKGKGGEIRAC